MFEEPSNPPKPLSLLTLGLALGVHVAIFLVFWLCALVIRHATPVVIPIDMTFVLHENLDKEPDDLPPSDEPKQPEPEPEPEPPKITPPPPPKIEPKQEAVITEKPKKEEPKKAPPKKEPPKKFVKGKRITRKNDSKKPKEDFTKLRAADRRTGNGPRTDKKMSAAEIAKWLALGAREGTKNQLPDNELSRCLGLIKNRFYEVWDQPSWTENLKPTVLEIRFGAGGRILGFKVVTSSGDKEVDDSVRRAAARVDSVPGLTAEFLSDYATLQIAFEVTPQ